MPRIPVPFTGSSIISHSAEINNQRTVNMYPVIESLGAKNTVTLKEVPGKTKLGNAGGGPFRSDWVEWEGNLYAVSGTELIKLDDDLQPTSVGNLQVASSRCSLAAGFTQLGIVDGDNGYMWDGTTLTQISDPDFPGGDTITWLDQRFSVNDPGTGQFYASDINAGLAWNPLWFATPESVPDDLSAVKANTSNLLLVGTRSTEFYYNSRNPDFTFDQIPGAVLDRGTNAPHSLIETEGSFFMLAQNKQGGKTVVMTRGRQFIYISADIQDALDKLTVVSDAVGMAYSEGKNSFYQLTFPTEDKTFVYDIGMQLWHERESFGYGRDFTNGIGYINGVHVIGHHDSNAYYKYDRTVFEEDGEIISRRRRMQVISKDGKYLFHNRFTLDCKTGVGTVTGQGSDPIISLRYSDDGGESFSSWLETKLGKIGETKQEVYWDCLGQSKDRVYETRFTDPAELSINNAYLDIEPGYN